MALWAGTKGKAGNTPTSHEVVPGRVLTDGGPVYSPAVTQQQLQRVGTPVGKQIIQVSSSGDVVGLDLIALAEHFAEAFRGWLL